MDNVLFVLVVLSLSSLVFSQDTCTLEFNITSIPNKIVSLSVYDTHVIIGTVDDTATVQGTWYLYERKSSSDGYIWTQLQNKTGTFQYYGSSVAIWDDIILIGDPTTNVGQVEVWKYDTSLKKYSHYYTQQGSGGDYLGRSVALSDTVGLMGAAAMNRIITEEKAWNYTQTLSNIGNPAFFTTILDETIAISTDGFSVKIFDRNAATKLWNDPTTAAIIQAGTGFGTSVSFLDVDNIAVTAPDINYVHFFQRDGTNNWVLKGEATIGTTGDQFGFSSVRAGEYLVVGAPSTDLSLSVQNAGIVYIIQVIELDNGTYTFGNYTTLFSPYASASEGYGKFVAVHENTLAVANALIPGSVYIYNCDPFTASNNDNNNGGGDSNKLSPKEAAIVSGWVLFFVVGMACAGFGYLWYKGRQERGTQSYQPTSLAMTPVVVPERTTIRDVESSGYDSTFWEIDYKEIKNIKKLGNGAFGVVYLASWRNAFCAVKQILGKSDTAAVKQFQKEASHMQKLRPHPHVLGMLGVCTNPKYPMCIVTEFMNDGSLYDLLHNHNVTIDGLTVLDMATQIASGLSHLHSENMLHKDLATRNVLIMKKGNGYHLKIADFGMGTQTSEEVYEASSETKFPIRWSPPEVISSRIFSVRSDVWSYGVTVWEMLERKMPYPDMTNKEVIDYVCNQNGFPSKPTLIKYKPELWDIMFACFQKNPDLRPTSQYICAKLSETLLSDTDYYNTLGITKTEHYN